MNYAIGPNTDRRTLTASSETAGGNDIMSRSTTNNSCGPTAMIALNGSNCAINAPVADFSGTPTIGCNNVTVNFTDLSTGGPFSCGGCGWSWTFTGGVPATSTVQNPTVVYSTPGVYNVSLTVTNAFGSDAQTYTNYITVNNCPPPTALFYGTPTTICAGQQVAFFDTSSNAPTSWSWTFPGGTPGTSTAQNPVVAYSAGGVYNVTLTATNAYGSNTLTRTAYITVNNCPPTPVANFSATPTSLCAGNTVAFTDLSTNTPTSWNWSFPGGTPATSVAQNPVITYSTSGVYSVTLVASNASGSNSFTQTNYITVNTCAAPVANFTGWPTTICLGQSVNFTDLSTNSPTSWSWTFAGGVPATSTLQNPTVSYAAAGNYNVTLTATNSFGNNSFTRTAYINVNSCPASGTGLVVNDGSLIHVQNTGLITVQGGFINQDNGANIGNIDNNGQITLTGDWTNNSVSNAFINIDSGEVQLLGSSQLITGMTPTYFFNLTLLGSGIKTQTLDARVLGTLALNDRELNTQGNVMYVTNATTTAITRSGGFNSTPVQGFVSSTGNGRLWRNTNSTGTYLFPVGSSLITPRYRPVEIQPASSAANTFGVRFVNNDPNADGLNRNNKDMNLGVINGLWYQRLNHVTGTNAANITIYFDDAADGVSSVANTLMTQWGFGVTPVQWRDLGTVTPVAAASPALSKVTKSAWNTFTTENFNIAPQSIPLPVELINLHAVCTGTGVNVMWETISEINSNYFSVERSENGISFEEVGVLSAAGNSSTVREYKFTDDFTPAKTVYYRLVQVDFDHRSYSYNPLAVNCRISGTDDYADVFPNPFSKDASLLLNIRESGKVVLLVSNTLGETVRSFSFNLKKGTHELPLSLDDLAPGFYSMVVKTPSQNIVVKMIRGK
jgi:PKD repeat protein